ncbi:MAG: TRAP transporter TatT component family protein [candidate division WOR-3 bacterium]
MAPSNEKLLYLWARIHFQFGENSTSTADKLRWYERTKAICETLRTLNENNPLGHLWWASAYGRIGQLRGVMRSLFMVPVLKQEFTRTLELDPANATAHDALGVLYYTLPAFAGGSLAKAEEHLCKALSIDPNYTLARLDLAKTYLKAGHRAEARRQLELVLATTNPTIPADYFLDDRPEAERLLRELGNQ